MIIRYSSTTMIVHDNNPQPQSSFVKIFAILLLINTAIDLIYIMINSVGYFFVQKYLLRSLDIDPQVQQSNVT